MIRKVIQLAIFLLMANAVYRIVPVALHYYKFKDAVQELALFSQRATDAQLVDRVMELAQRAHDILGCRDMSRVDVMLNERNEPFLLEINTIPGFTPKSLLPEAAAHNGIDFVKLVDRLVKRAAKRGATARAA